MLASALCRMPLPFHVTSHPSQRFRALLWATTCGPPPGIHVLVSHTLLSILCGYRTYILHVLTVLPQDPRYILHRESTQQQFAASHSTALGSFMYPHRWHSGISPAVPQGESRERFYTQPGGITLVRNTQWSLQDPKCY